MPDTSGSFYQALKYLNENESKTLSKREMIPMSDIAILFPAIITRPFEHMTFQFREDGWLNMTKAAKAFGKHLHNFWKHSDTAPYMDELALSIGDMDKSDLVQTRCGNGLLPSVGTWGHPRLAVFFARCCELVNNSLDSNELNAKIDRTPGLRNLLNYLKPYHDGLIKIAMPH